MTFLIQQTLIYAIPLMIVALAGVFAERSGIINLALEGIMIFGAFIGVLFVREVQQLEVFQLAKEMDNYLALQGLELMAMAAAAVMGAIFSLLLSFASVNLPRRPDHRRHGPEPHGPGHRPLLHPHHRQPEHHDHGLRRLCQLVHDQEGHVWLRTHGQDGLFGLHLH